MTTTTKTFPGKLAVQQRVLGLIFGQPARRFQSAELIRLAPHGDR